jgi:hypothetical protein
MLVSARFPLYTLRLGWKTDLVGCKSELRRAVIQKKVGASKVS